jgi:hypothetical protein
MSSLTQEKLINVYIQRFIKYANLPVNESVINQFMKQAHINRTINLTSDIFLMVCSYLPFQTIISFASCTKKYKPHYKKIWKLIEYQHHYKKSTINILEYKTIRDSISLDSYYYYYKNYKNNEYQTTKIINSLVKEETSIENLVVKVDKLNPSGINYKITKQTHIGEIKARLKDRTIIYNKLSKEIQIFLNDFKCNSKSNKFCTYYTLKKTLDTRLYGYNNEWENGKIILKWATDEYNSEPDYDFNHSDDEDSDFEYEDDGNRVNEYFRTRTRIKPHFVSVAINGWCSCACDICRSICEKQEDCVHTNNYLNDEAIFADYYEDEFDKYLSEEEKNESDENTLTLFVSHETSTG